MTEESKPETPDSKAPAPATQDTSAGKGAESAAPRRKSTSSARRKAAARSARTTTTAPSDTVQAAGTPARDDQKPGAPSGEGTTGRTPAQRDESAGERERNRDARPSHPQSSSRTDDAPTRRDERESSSPNSNGSGSDSGNNGTGELPRSSRNRNRKRNRGRNRSRERGGDRPTTASEPALDPEEWKSKAWQIYAAEFSEEGVALFDDKDAAELARRSFRLAEIFMREQSLRMNELQHRPQRDQARAGSASRGDERTPFADTDEDDDADDEADDFDAEADTHQGRQDDAHDPDLELDLDDDETATPDRETATAAGGNAQD